MAKLGELISKNGPEQNLDEETIQQQKLIEEEVAKAQPLIAEKQSLAALEAEYNEKDSKEYFNKAKNLRQKFDFIRRVRGDGNCFYRAVAFAHLERLICQENRFKAGVSFERFRTLANGWKERMLKVGYPPMTSEDFCDVFHDFLKQLEENPCERQLIEILNNQAESDYIVVFMRLVTGAYLLENEETYSGFIEGADTMKKYVEQEIHPIARECDHLCIIALSKALDIPIRIEYMDRSQAPSGGWHHDFTLTAGQEPTIYFLYRPGHYDILYPKMTSVPAS